MAYKFMLEEIGVEKSKELGSIFDAVLVKPTVSVVHPTKRGRLSLVEDRELVLGKDVILLPFSTETECMFSPLCQKLTTKLSALL